jgi:putative redox protein
MRASIKWQENMHFKCFNDQHTVDIDATKEHGGNDQGPSPKMMLLNAMMGCTAMDAIAILKKMRLTVQSFSMDIEATKNEDYPIHFKSALLSFKFNGDLKEEKVIKAVTKSLTQYCGVNYMVSKVCKIRYEIFLNEQKIYEDQANFVDPQN